jgi:hypothetical protein
MSSRARIAGVAIYDQDGATADDADDRFHDWLLFAIPFGSRQKER